MRSYLCSGDRLIAAALTAHIYKEDLAIRCCSAGLRRSRVFAPQLPDRLFGGRGVVRSPGRSTEAAAYRQVFEEVCGAAAGRARARGVNTRVGVAGTQEQRFAGGRAREEDEPEGVPVGARRRRRVAPCPAGSSQRAGSSTGCEGACAGRSMGGSCGCFFGTGLSTGSTRRVLFGFPTSMLLSVSRRRVRLTRSPLRIAIGRSRP